MVRLTETWRKWESHLDDDDDDDDDAYLVNAWDIVDGQLLERALELLVVGRGGLVDDLLLSAWDALAADDHRAGLLLELLKLVQIWLEIGLAHLSANNLLHYLDAPNGRRRHVSSDDRERRRTAGGKIKGAPD